MKYDAFISYRHQDPDADFAWDLVAKLEDAGYTVAIDDRAFKPNASFLEEMERCVRESRFTLAIVSPRYFESGNTVEEAIICKVLDMDERKRRLIPLMIEKVERPAWMYTLVGIDFTTSNPRVDPIEKLIRTLSKRSLTQQNTSYSGRDDPTSKDDMLLPNNPFYVEGPMPLDSPSYIKRYCEKELESLLKTKSLIAVYGTYEFGKTSLLARIPELLEFIRD